MKLTRNLKMLLFDVEIFLHIQNYLLFFLLVEFIQLPRKMKVSYFV
jgi:hypothetical protein